MSDRATMEHDCDDPLCEGGTRSSGNTSVDGISKVNLNISSAGDRYWTETDSDMWFSALIPTAKLAEWKKAKEAARQANREFDIEYKAAIDRWQLRQKEVS